MTRPVTIPGPRRAGPVEFFIDCQVMAVRRLRLAVRVPQMILGTIFQPLMFVLLFSYIFGEALGGDRYREFLIGGIMTQAVAFNAAFSALGLATEMADGVVNRFRVMPMSRLALVVGRTLSDLVINMLSLIVMSLTGLAIGWRVNEDLWLVAAGFAIVLAFGFAMSWVGAVVGLRAGSAEAAQSLMASILFPLTFISSAFVPSETLPGVLQDVANWNPVTAVARSLRECFGNPTAVNPLMPEPVTWASEHAELYSVMSCLVIVTVCIPLAASGLNRSRY